MIRRPVLIAIAAAAALGAAPVAQARPAGRARAAAAKPARYALLDAQDDDSSAFLIYKKTKKWELPEANISGTYTEQKSGKDNLITYVGENPLSEEECEITLTWPRHPTRHTPDPFGLEKCFTRSGPLPWVEVYLLGVT
ncbi:MAG TPA: hypothetical protein VGY13_00765 [Solirubrobacteraceae bacterium]|jgi:hypothetical protein|nr:hypothetical protein [Solirubrobacteraceae bacterium]